MGKLNKVEDDIHGNNEAYQNLANAIVLQAVTDYRHARKFVMKHRDDYPPERIAEIYENQEKRHDEERKAYRLVHGNLKKYRFIPTPEERMAGMVQKKEETLLEIEQFFKSAFYQVLTSIDGEILLKKLSQEIYDEKENDIDADADDFDEDKNSDSDDLSEEDYGISDYADVD